MSWFVIALVGPIFLACANQTDKHLLDEHLHGEVGSLIIFSSLFSAVALPIIVMADPAAYAVGLGLGVLLAINGMLTVIAVLFYFYALSEDDASCVVPFYQTIPIFALALGYIILDET